MNRTEPREDARLNRERVIDAARDVFRERGLAAEMRDIAERAGLAVGTIYRNYPSKDDLILALLDGALADVGVSATHSDAVADLQGLVTNMIEMVAKYGWLIEAYLGRQLSANCREVIQRKSLEFDFRGRCRAFLTRGIEAGQLRPDLGLDQVVALLAGVTSPWVCQPLLALRSPPELAASVVRTLLEGIETHQVCALPVPSASTDAAG